MSDEIRLPFGVKPVNYDLFFDVDLKKCKFFGKETVDIVIQKATKKIILHSSGLNVTDAILLIKNKPLKASISESKKLEKLILTFPENVSGSAQLLMKFDGELTDNLIGLYRSKYTSNGKEKYMAATQFEATYARRAFPCFDEPAYKATFDVTMSMDSNLQAISNMPVREEKKKDDKIIVTFDRTPKMSTYLLYLSVGEFDILEDKLGKTIIRIITIPGKKNQAELAMDLTKKFLDYFQKYSKIPYPLPKLDMIAIPDFASGAMENWGAITFRESALLFDPKTSSVAAKKRIAMIIAHELWHQWSGNLVTMKWWNDLWLNESFATFMAYKAVNSFFPEWRTWEDFIMEETDGAFDEDSIVSTHPIEVEVKDPHQLEEIFDAISYNKGGSVLRMIEDYMGVEDFRDGIDKYLQDYKYQNATADDLWRYLTGVSKKPIKKLAAGWIRQPGYPIVEANLKGDTLELSQRRFVFNSKDNSTWPIPLTIKADSKVFTDLMTNTKKKIPLKCDWFKINFGQCGFYRVKYDDNSLSCLKPVIEDKELPAIDRWGVQSDLFRLSRHGEITVDKYLDFMKCYEDEDNYLVLGSIYGSMRSIYFVFSQDKVWNVIKPKFNKLFFNTFNSVLEKLGWEPKDGESEKDALLRDLALRYMSFVEDNSTRKIALEKFNDYFRSKALHPNIRSAVFSIAAASSADTYDKLIAIYNRSESPEEKRQILSALGNFKDTKVLEKALEFSISNKVRKQDIYVTFASASGNPTARSILMNWCKRNWKQLESYKHSHRLFIYIVESLITAHVTKEKESEIREFFKAHPVDYKMTLNKSFDRMKRNIMWREKNMKVLEKYLGS